MLTNPTERFTGRVESYRRYRPGYPGEIVDVLQRECGLGSQSLIADIAAGTGLLTEIFLKAGFAVTAVEPNAEMRAACAALAESYPKLHVIAGTAEATGLADASVDLITVAQAMHWFDLDRTRKELARVLKPGGSCAVIYNDRRQRGDAFHEGYERLLLDFSVDYVSVKQQHVSRERLAQFFAPSEIHCAAFPNAQSLTLEGLQGRIFSSSYIPQEGNPRHADVKKAAEQLFRENEQNGIVRLDYECVVCWAPLA